MSYGELYETVTTASKPWCYPLPGGPEEITLKNVVQYGELIDW